MRRKYRSYLKRNEESRHIKRAIALTISTIAIGLLILFFGLPAIINFSSFVAGLKKSNTPVEVNDTTPPIVPRFDTLPEATNNAKLKLSGTTEPGAFVTIEYGIYEDEVVAGSDGSFNLIINLKEGDNTIRAYSEDSSGNKSTEVVTADVKYDTTPPKFDVETPSNGSTFYGSKQRQVTISGITETDSQITINDRFVYVEEDGKFAFATTLSDGENKFIVKSTDAAGNSSEKELTLNFTP